VSSDSYAVTRCHHLLSVASAVCVLQGLGEADRSVLLQDAARWVVDHLFGTRSQCSKVCLCVGGGQEGG